MDNSSASSYEQKICFYFILPVWGSKYTNHVIDILIPTCLSVNNIPSLKNIRNSRFIFISDQESYKKISEAPIFNLLQKYIKPEFVQFEFEDDGRSKHTKQTIAYRQGTQKALEAKACCVYLTADLVVSDGTISYLEKLVVEGKGMVFLPGPRVNEDEFLDKIKNFRKQQGIDIVDAISLPAREMVRLGLTCFHKEFTSYDIMNKEFTANPQYIIHSLGRGKGFLVKAFHQHLLLVNLKLLPEDLVFDEASTIDGRFVEDNLISTNYLYYETDSDNMLVYSLTDRGYIGGQIKAARRDCWFATVQDAIFYMVHTNMANKMHQFAFINTYAIHVEDLDESYMESNKILRCFSEKIIKYNPTMLSQDIREYKIIKDIKIINIIYSGTIKLLRSLKSIIKRTPLYNMLR